MKSHLLHSGGSGLGARGTSAAKGHGHGVAVAVVTAGRGGAWRVGVAMVILITDSHCNRTSTRIQLLPQNAHSDRSNNMSVHCNCKMFRKQLPKPPDSARAASR